MRPLALILCLLLSGCGNLQNLAAKARAKRQQKQLNKLAEAATNEISGRIGERAVGEIVYVDGDNGYALVRARNGVSLPVSEELECRGGTGSGRLKVTPERKNTFYAADILSGTPQKGDPVIAMKSKTKQEPKLVPIVANAPAGGNAPPNTVSLDPGSIRPEDLPRSNLDEPGTAVRTPAPPSSRPQPDPGNLLLPPPELPQ